MVAEIVTIVTVGRESQERKKEISGRIRKEKKSCGGAFFCLHGLKPLMLTVARLKV